MIVTYLDQLRQIAVETGWKLSEACEDSKIAPSTLYRWQRGLSRPSEKAAQKIARYMQTYRRSETSPQSPN